MRQSSKSPTKGVLNTKSARLDNQTLQSAHANVSIDQKSKASLFSQKMVDYVTGQTNEKHIAAVNRELSEAIAAKDIIADERNEVVLENCFLKRRLARDKDEIERLENENAELRTTANKALAKAALFDESEVKREENEALMLKETLESQAALLKAVQAERDRLTREVRRGGGGSKPEKGTQLDQIYKSARCFVNFEGWVNLARLRKGAINEVGSQTIIKDITQEVNVIAPPAEGKVAPKEEKLFKMRKLPPVDVEIQTDKEMLKSFIKSRGYRHRASAMTGTNDANS